MKEYNIQIPYKLYDSEDKLPNHIALLLANALEATQSSYAPYSNFFVGCAILLSDGEVVLGSNQENAAYPSGICAERSALFAYGSLLNKAPIEAIAIRAHTPNWELNSPIFPCGACRQVMIEFEQRNAKPIELWMQGASGPIMQISGIAGKILPFIFKLS